MGGGQWWGGEEGEDFPSLPYRAAGSRWRGAVDAAGPGSSPRARAEPINEAHLGATAANSSRLALASLAHPLHP